MSNYAVCPGPITTDVDGHLLCVDGWQSAVVSVPFDVSAIDPGTAAAFIGSGFFILLPLWAAVYGGRVLLNAIH